MLSFMDVGGAGQITLPTVQELVIKTASGRDSKVKQSDVHHLLMSTRAWLLSMPNLQKIRLRNTGSADADATSQGQQCVLKAQKIAVAHQKY